MLCGVVSDTHWRRPREFNEKLLQALEGVDLILHAGDVQAEWVLERLESVAPVLAVRGNCDPLNFSRELPLSRCLEWEGVQVGMCHGHNLDLSDPQEVVDAFAGEMQVVIHGHIHVPKHTRHGGCSIFCPGSPCFPRDCTPASLGFLEIKDGEFQLRHQQFVG